MILEFLQSVSCMLVAMFFGVFVARMVKKHLLKKP